MEPSQRRRLRIVLFAALLLARWPAAAAGSQDCLPPLTPCGTPRVVIHATVDPGTRRLDATTELHVVNCSDQPLAEIPILLPGAMHGAVEDDLDDRNFRWRYPHDISLTDCRIDAGAVTEGPGLAGDPAGPCAVLQALALESPLPVGAALTLSLTTSMTIPERFGTFGAARGILTLRGGWHPTLPVLGSGGFRPGDGPGRVHYDATVTPSIATRILLGDRLQAAGPAQAGVWSGETWDPLNLVVSGALRETVVRTGGHTVTLIHTAPDPEPRDPYTPGDLLQTDWSAARVAGVERVLRGLRDPYARRAWTLVVVPMLENLAVPGEDLVYLAESLYEITGTGLLSRYHDSALAAALVTASLRRARPETHPWVAMVNGAWLQTHLNAQTDLGAVRDLTRKGEFIHAIDQFGTDARIPQEHLFFQRVQDRNPYAGESELAATELPSPWAANRLLDEIGAVRALAPDGPWEGAFCRWVQGGHREELDLSVRVRRVRRPDGAEESLVEARRIGPGSGLPVRVRLEHRNGGTRDVVWDTTEETARWRVRGRLRRATVDPEGRILQRRERQTQDLRFNDTSRQDLKWVFARPWISLTSGERIPTAYVELNLQRRHHLRSTWVLQPRLFPQRAEILVGHRWGFGRLASRNRSRWQLTLGIKGAAGFDDGGSFSPSLKSLLYYDTRSGSLAPFKGGWVYTYVEGFPGDSRGGWRLSTKFGVGGSKIFGRRPDLVFVVRGLADTRLGETPEWESLSVNGILGVRGLNVAGFAPKHRLAASAELRWMPARSFRASLAKTVFLRSLQLVLFTDAALLGTDYDDWFETRYLYQSAGIGVRFHADLFGIFPVMLSIDEAVVLPLYGKELAFGTLAYFSQAF